MVLIINKMPKGYMDPSSRKKQGLRLPLKVDRQCCYSMHCAQPAATKEEEAVGKDQQKRNIHNDRGPFFAVGSHGLRQD